MTLSQWQTNSHYFEYRGHQIFYRITGTGPDLVLLHGFPTASWDWHKTWERLTASYRVITFDFIGFGLSDKPRDYNYSLMDQADLTEALLAHLNVRQYHLLAHDYGSTVAQELLARHYERGTEALRSVALLNGGIFPGQHFPRPIQNMLASRWGFLLTPFLSKAMLRRNFDTIFGPNTKASAAEIDTFYTLMTQKRGKRLFHRLIKYMNERVTHQERWVGALCRGELPQCYINGMADPISGVHVGEYYLKVVNNATVYFLEDIGHYPQSEAPEQVLEYYFIFQQKK